MNQLASLTDNELALSAQLAHTELLLLNSRLETLNLAGPQAEVKLRVLLQEQERRAAEKAKPAAPLVEPPVEVPPLNG